MPKMLYIQNLNLANHHPARITKANKNFVKKLDFKNVNFQ